MATEADVSTRGAELLRLYDAILTLKRREVEELRKGPRRNKRVRTYQALVKQRDKVRRSLGPVLRAGQEMNVGADESVAVHSDDDIETLLEKADLARDLEERFLRRAQAVQRRIREMMEERAVARDVVGMVRDQSLFDEDDMRLYVVSDQVGGSAPGLAAALPSGGGAVIVGRRPRAASVGGSPAGNGFQSEDEGFQDEDSATGGGLGGGNGARLRWRRAAADDSPDPSNRADRKRRRPEPPSAGAGPEADGGRCRRRLHGRATKAQRDAADPISLAARHRRRGAAARGRAGVLGGQRRRRPGGAAVIGFADAPAAARAREEAARARQEDAQARDRPEEGSRRPREALITRVCTTPPTRPAAAAASNNRRRVLRMTDAWSVVLG